MAAMITIGGIDLGYNFVLRGLDSPPISAATQRSDAGVMLVLLADQAGGRTMTLHGWYTMAQEAQLDALMATKVPVALSHPRFSGSVLIIGKELEDWDELVDPDDTEYREGNYTLLEI